jgi:hypothetical protein
MPCSFLTRQALTQSLKGRSRNSTFVALRGNKMIYRISASINIMVPQDLLSILSSPLRIEILKLTGERAMSINEMISELTRRGFRVKYRESVYKVVEKLVSVGIADKYYDTMKKSIVYKLQKTRVEIDLKTGMVTCS